MTVLSSALANSQENSMEKTFARPLITGASVSADRSAISPGKKLALKYTDKKNIKTIAFGGTPGTETWKMLKPSDFKDRSIVIAIDFFFWDSFLPSQQGSIDVLKKLVESARVNNIPIVLGEIPNLIPGRQPGREKLNSEMASLCSKNKDCYIMPFDQLYKQVTRDQGLTIKGRKYSIRELVPDGLHLADIAAVELMDRLEATLRGG